MENVDVRPMENTVMVIQVSLQVEVIDGAVRHSGLLKRVTNARMPTLNLVSRKPRPTASVVFVSIEAVAPAINEDFIVHVTVSLEIFVDMGTSEAISFNGSLSTFIMHLFFVHEKKGRIFLPFILATQRTSTVQKVLSTSNGGKGHVI